MTFSSVQCDCKWLHWSRHVLLAVFCRHGGWNAEASCARWQNANWQLGLGPSPALFWSALVWHVSRLCLMDQLRLCLCTASPLTCQPLGYLWEFERFISSWPQVWTSCAPDLLLTPTLNPYILHLHPWKLCKKIFSSCCSKVLCGQMCSWIRGSPEICSSPNQFYFND